MMTTVASVAVTDLWSKHILKAVFHRCFM